MRVAPAGHAGHKHALSVCSMQRCSHSTAPSFFPPAPPPIFPAGAGDEGEDAEALLGSDSEGAAPGGQCLIGSSGLRLCLFGAGSEQRTTLVS